MDSVQKPVEEERRSPLSSVAAGVLLVVLGVVLLAFQVVPGLARWTDLDYSWPVVVIAVGLGMLVLGLATGVPGLSVPACIVGGVGCILYYQTFTGDWESWAYVWPLIPGFAGLGTILMGLQGHKTRQSLQGGAWTVLVSLTLFVVFASFFGALGLGPFGSYWPVLLIVLGLVVFVRSLVRSR